MKKFLTLFFTGLLSLLAALVLVGCGNGLDSSTSESPKGNYDYIHGENPNEGIEIDGYNNEEIWENKNYFTNHDVENNISYYVTTHFTDKGLYIYAFTNDTNIIYMERNSYNYNSHFYFVIAANPNAYALSNTGLCRALKLDSSNYTMPTNFLYIGKTVVNGEVNSGETNGMSCEVFVSWDELNTSKVDEIKLFSAYRMVDREGQSGTYLTCAFGATYVGTYQRYNTNGFIDTNEDAGILGTSGYGTSKSGGIESVSEGMQVVARGDNTAFFDIYSSKFVVNTTIKVKDKAYASGSTARAGLYIQLPSGYYRALQFDLKNSNIDENNNVSINRLFATSNYPDSNHIRTKTVHEGVEGSYDELKLTIIKDEAYLYYIVNGELVNTENLIWLKGKVKVGVYSQNANVLFTDYSSIDCDKDQTSLENEIVKYGYKIKTVTNASDYKFIVDESKFVVAKGESFNFNLLASSGKKIDKVYDNGIDVTEKLLRNYSDGVYSLTGISGNINLSATTIDLENYVTLKGNVTNSEGKAQSGAEVRIESDEAFNSYYAKTSKNGNFEVNLKSNTTYKVTIIQNGYRETSYTTVVKDTNLEESYKVQQYLVGGNTVDPNNTLASYYSNPAAWDMTRESNSYITLDLQDRTSGGNVYFTDVFAENVVINVTITNITDRNIGTYEKDPGAGIVVANITDGDRRSSIYNLYQAGYRVRLKGSYASDSLFYNKGAAKTNLATSSDSIKLTLMRIGTLYYMFIDDTLVYSVDNPYIQGPAAYGFTFDSSSTLALAFEDYSIVTGDAAVEQAQQVLYSQFIYDKNTIEIDGLENDMGLYQTTPVISAKGIEGNKVAHIQVDDESYYLSSKNNAIEHPIDKYDVTGMPDVNVTFKGTLDGQLIKGSVNKQGSVPVVIVSSNGTKSYINTDSEGKYELYLPSGSYNAYAKLDGYSSDSVSFTVENSEVNVGEISLNQSILVNKVQINGGPTVWSRPSAYQTYYNEETNRYSINVDQNGNGGAIYLEEQAVSKNILIKYSFVKNASKEPNPGVGIWVVTSGSPDQQNSIRFVYAGGSANVRDQVTNQSATWPSGKMSYNLNDNDGIQYDAAFVREGKTYYMYLKLSTEDTYKLVYTYTSETVPGYAAYGFAVTGSQEMKFEIFDYSYSTSQTDINSFKEGANNE